MIISCFNKRFETPHGLLSFYFNRIRTDEGLHFHVHFVKGNLAYVFLMVELDEQWHLADKHNHPHWLLSMENHFREHIAEHINP